MLRVSQDSRGILGEALTLLHHAMPCGLVNEHLSGVAGGDEEAGLELHRLGTLHASLTRHNDLDTEGPRLHDGADDTVASAAHLETTKQLELERLGLRHGGEAAVQHALSEHLDGALGEAKALLHGRGELADTLALLAQHLAGAGGADDDLSAHGGPADFHAGVAVLSELLLKHLVELGEEYTVVYELPAPLAR